MEKLHIQNTLSLNGYPKRFINRGMERMKDKREKKEDIKAAIVILYLGILLRI